MVPVTSNDLYHYCVLVSDTNPEDMKQSKKAGKAQRIQEMKVKEQAAPKPKAPEEVDENVRGDYGGLPDRDLKKNLGGCG